MTPLTDEERADATEQRVVAAVVAMLTALAEGQEALADVDAFYHVAAARRRIADAQRSAAAALERGAWRPYLAAGDGEVG